MASTKRSRMKCPKCGHAMEIKYIQSVNTAQDPELVGQVLDFSINNINCESCGSQVFIDDYFLFNDMERHYLVAKYPQSELARWKDVVAADRKMFSSVPEELQVDFENRLVFGPFALKEKILLKQNGIDDKVMEMYKVGLFGEIGETYFNGRYRIYYLNSDQEGYHVMVLVDVEQKEEKNLIKVPVETFDKFREETYPTLLGKELVDLIVEPPFVSMEKMFFAPDYMKN